MRGHMLIAKKYVDGNLALTSSNASAALKVSSQHILKKNVAIASGVYEICSINAWKDKKQEFT